MKTTSNILAAFALSLLAVAGAHAETYEGVQPLSVGNSRADVAQQGAVAARAGNVYGDAASENIVAPVGAVDRATVRDQAIAAAHAPGQNLRSESFPASQIPALAKSRTFTRQAGL